MATNYFITLAKCSFNKTVISSGSIGSTGSAVPRSTVPHISLTQGDDWNVKCTNLAIKILFPYKGEDTCLKQFSNWINFNARSMRDSPRPGTFSINNPYVTETWN